MAVALSDGGWIGDPMLRVSARVSLTRSWRTGCSAADQRRQGVGMCCSGAFQVGPGLGGDDVDVVAGRLVRAGDVADALDAQLIDAGNSGVRGFRCRTCGVI